MMKNGLSSIRNLRRIRDRIRHNPGRVTRRFTSLVAKLRAAKEQTDASEAAAAAALPIAETHGYKGNILYDRRRNMVREWAQVW